MKNQLVRVQIDDKICQWKNNCNIITQCRYLNNSDGYCYQYNDSLMYNFELSAWGRCSACIQNDQQAIFV